VPVLARTPEDIGLLIRDQRLKLGLDQRSLAERVGVSRQWLVEVEKGKARAEVGLILRTLAALELQVDISSAGSERAAQPAKVGARPRVRIDLNEVIDRARGKKP
jgi:HTH-type transcriptional regulator/antitoxin HipB